jgi:hypothetical protein
MPNHRPTKSCVVCVSTLIIKDIIKVMIKLGSNHALDLLFFILFKKQFKFENKI